MVGEYKINVQKSIVYVYIYKNNPKVNCIHNSIQKNKLPRNKYDQKSASLYLENLKANK